MPWKAVGKNVMHQVDGKWKVKQHCTSEENAKKAVKLLYMKKEKGEIKE